jgi:hypothetical protein
MNAVHLRSICCRFLHRTKGPRTKGTPSLRLDRRSSDPGGRFVTAIFATVLILAATISLDAVLSISQARLLLKVIRTATNKGTSISLNGANPLKTECGETFNDPGANATDAAGKVIPVHVSGTVDIRTLGSYTVTYTAADDKDSISVERTVIVVDTTAPEISLKGARTMTLRCGEPFVEPGASAIDSCQGSVPVVPAGNVDPNVQGRYTITYTAVDASNNSKTVEREVIVGSIEDNPPTITMVGQRALTIECGSSFIDPGATAVTPCSGPTPVFTDGIVDVQTVGLYTIVYTANAGELKSEAARSVTVVDSTAPVISLTGDNPLTIARGNKFNDPGAIARDTCASEFAATATSNVDTNTSGSYTIIYTAKDPAGNQASPMKRTVNVIEAPPTTTIRAAGVGSSPLMRKSTRWRR